MGTRCADHVTPLYPQKLALTSPTGGGRSVGIVRSRTKATVFFFHIGNTEVMTISQCLLTFQSPSHQPSLLSLRVLPLSAIAHTIDARIIKSYFVTIYIYMIFIMI